MNISKSKLGLIGGVSAIGLAVFFTFSTNNSQSNSAQHSASEVHTSSIQHAPLVMAPSAQNSDIQSVKRTEAPFANQAAIRTFYEQRMSDRLLARLKESQLHLERNGHLVPYDDPLDAFWSLKEFKELEKFEATNEAVTAQLGYTPVSHVLGDKWNMENQLLMGRNDRAEVITRLSQDDKQVIIMQKKWNGTEKMFAEYVNYRIGKDQNIGAIYQHYDNKKLQNITMIDPQFSYTIYTLNFSQKDLDSLMSKIAPAT